jgi:two-component system OmpR family response regulator
MTPRKTTILHVEDDASLQNLVRVALESLGGYAVRTAADGIHAMSLARDVPPDLLLLDLDLGGRDAPGMNGIATLRALRQLPGLAGVPVVFLTAMNDPAVEVELLALGVHEVLRKPFRLRPLVDAIGRILERHEA